MRKITTLCLLFSILGCAHSALKPTPPPNKYFVNTEGCFLLYNLTTESFEKILGGETCKESLPASSTFKVPLAVMAFDSGVLENEDVTLKWDGTRDIRQELNRDHNAKSWMKHSVVWFSQRLTERLGKERLKNYLKAFNYGNQDLSGGITEAWLLPPRANGLKISAYEQVDFMKKLWTDSLPAEKSAMNLTRKITFLETSPRGFNLSGKTGSNFYNREKTVHLGWFISHLEKADQEYITVALIKDQQPTARFNYGGPRAKQLTKQILTDLSLW